MLVLQEDYIMSTANLNHPVGLVKLVDFESRIQETTISGMVKTKFRDSNQYLEIEFQGSSYFARVDRPLIHRLGGRLWGAAYDYLTIRDLWIKKVKRDIRNLEREISVSLQQKKDFIIRHYLHNGKNMIYGIITQSFVNSNQLDFRALFIERAEGTGMISTKNSSVIQNNYGRITEYFDMNFSNKQTKFKYGLSYAKNTGYDAYKVDWGRFIIVCANGLTVKEGGSSSKWIHNNQAMIDDFIQQTIQEGIMHQTELEHKIELSSLTKLDRELLTEFVTRLHISPASRPRVINRYNEEARKLGPTEWALSQALTWLGSHEKALSLRPKQLLTEAGTAILETSLQDYLHQDNTYVARDGFYGAILPQ